MPVPSSVADLSTTPAGNSPLGSDAIGVSLDDYLRSIQALIKQQDSKGADIASATTITVPAAGKYFIVTGTTTIATIADSWTGRTVVLKFSGACQLTHSSGLILPGAANITTAAGDFLLVANESTGVWRGVAYQPATGYQASLSAASQAEMAAGTEAALRSMSPLRVKQAIDALASSKQIQPISASVAANALTISASALSLDFRSTTLGSGTVTRVNGTPANLVVPSTATLGTVNAVQSRLAVLALNNAGTLELAVVNIAGGNDLTETGVITTTTISAAADSADVIYSATGRTGVAYRVIGYVESTQATAGTWATAPSTTQGQGGQALAAMSSLGYGQTWKVVTGSRAIGTTYYNTTGKPIQIAVSTIASAGTSTLTVNGTVVIVTGGPVSTYTSISYVIPAGQSYVITGTPTLSAWSELR